MSMTIVPFIIIPLICVVLFFLVWRIESHSSFIFTPFLIIMVYELIHILPGFVSAYERGISKDYYSILVFFTGFVFLLVGFVCAIGCFRYRTSSPQLFQNKPVIINSEGEIFTAVVLGSFLLIIAGIYLYRGMPPVTEALINTALGGDQNEAARFIAASRKAITKGRYFGAAYRGEGIVMLLIRNGWPFIVSMAFVVYWKTRKFKWLFITIGLLILSFVFIAGDGTRAPFVNTIIMYIILFSLLKKITMRFMVTGFLFIVGISILLSLYSTKLNYVMKEDRAIILATIKILDRIVNSNSINDVRAIEFVRDGTIDLRMGGIHFRDMKAVLPGIAGGLPFSHELGKIIKPNSSKTMYASGTYITKLYVDFGIWGVGAGFLILGWLAGISQTFIFKMMIKDPFYLAAGSMFCYFTGDVVGKSLMGITATMIVFISFCFFVRSAMIIHRMLSSLSINELIKGLRRNEEF